MEMARAAYSIGGAQRKGVSALGDALMTKKRISRKKAQEQVTPAPVFILVEPQMGENIGAAARAMLNFGVSGLRLVNPRDGWPNSKAAAMSSGAAIVIDQTEVFSSVADAVADCQFVVATTARRREVPLPVLSPAETAQTLKQRVEARERCAVLFGGERNGLSSDDVAYANAILSIPVNPAFASLNLAQAASLVAYEWSRADRTTSVDNPMQETPPATRQELNQFLARLESALDDSGYFFPAEKRPGMVRNMRAAFSRAGFTELEISSLHGMIKSLSRKVDT